MWDRVLLPFLISMNSSLRMAVRTPFFISLTREEPHIIERFLKKRPIKGGVATDREDATFQCLWHTKYPSYLSHRLTRFYFVGTVIQIFFTAELLEEFLQTDKVPKVAEPTTSSETVPAVTPDTLFFSKN